ncbi:hypothetical protein RMSM_03901 [Rhodopirellula maiorica SM1]|uniref:Uncharacterized protein n=1 Tax=Rhodopirellula maiorica SM1 TaxID=1265738 RepID=M5RIN1_9BACT|nr:hypothetical protein RMSM_03901 [Rhodopirellula maiorica SM1]
MASGVNVKVASRFEPCAALDCGQSDSFPALWPAINADDADNHGLDNGVKCHGIVSFEQVLKHRG